MAVADGDDAAALAALNGTTHGQAVNAAAYLLSCLRVAVAAAAGPERLELALKAAAEGITEDQLIHQVALIMSEAERNNHE